jgi:hypothetical protein
VTYGTDFFLSGGYNEDRTHRKGMIKMMTIVEERRATVLVRKNSAAVQETLPPAIEAIKRDAMKNPELYVRSYTIPAEGE